MKRVAPFFVGVGLLFLLPSVASAATIVSQSINSSNTGFIAANNSLPIQEQTLGSGVGGVLSDVFLQLQFNATTTQIWTLDLYECTTNATWWNDGTCHDAANSSDKIPDDTGVIQWDFQFPTPYTLDPNKYYMLVLIKHWAGDGQTVKIYGSSSNAYTPGQCYVNTTGSTITNCPTINDMWFQLGGVLTYQSSVNIGNLSPSTGSTTPAVATLSFDYNATASAGASRYTIKLQRATQSGGGDPIYLSGVVTSGAHSIVRSASLADGIYGWNVNIDQGDIVGSTNWASYSTSFNVSASSTATYNDAYFAAFPELANATSSADFYNLIPFFSTIINKVPFGYVKQIIDEWISATGDTQNSNIPLVSLNLTSLGLGSTTSFGNFLPDIEFSTTTISTYISPTLHSAFFLLQDTSYWLALLYFLWRRGTNLIKA